MARYDRSIKASVSKDLRSVPKADVRRILERLEALRDNPRLPGCEKLSAQKRYRIRQGDTRIIDSVDDVVVTVVVVKVGHRKDVYRST